MMNWVKSGCALTLRVANKVRGQWSAATTSGFQTSPADKMPPKQRGGAQKGKAAPCDDGMEAQPSAAAPAPKAANSSAGGSKRLPFSFYDRDCATLAKALLGKRLVRELPDGRASGIIVETEAYLGGDDKAAHSHKGKNNKNAAMFMPPGTGYVYHIFGIHTCMNISSRGDGAAVLIRALDAKEGQEAMKALRGVKRSDKGDGLKNCELGSGPSKLAQALDINRKNVDQQDLTTLSHTWVEDAIDVEPEDIIVSTRINVDYAEEWAKKPLRFYLKGNECVSVRDKKAEAVNSTSPADEMSTKGAPKRKAAPCDNDDDDCATAAKVAPVEPPNTKATPTKGEGKAKPSKGTSATPASKAASSGGSKRLPFSFYDRDCATLAKALLGKRLVRELPDGRASGIIVETEAYLGGDDKAAHSHKGKNNKNAAMFMPPGTGYVYHIFGIHTCMNISSRGDGAAVLIRALDAKEGQEAMKALRGVKRSDKGDGLKNHELGSGPSKLAQALDINRKNVDQQDLTTLSHTWVEDAIDVEPEDIIVSTRINVDYAEEWAKKPLRFYLKGNECVSVRDKKAEADA